MTLTRIAHALAASGCRVLLFDLFGRGLSATPADLPHDTRLYVTQVLLVLASSPLSWTGSHACSVVGYSMGGAVAVAFAEAFPHILESLVLLAPAGLIRAENFGAASRFLFQSGWVPPRILEAMTRRRLRMPIAASVTKITAAASSTTMASEHSSSLPQTRGPGYIRDEAVAFAEGETTDNHPPSSVEDPLETAVTRYVHWMLDYHDGFVPAFVGCVASAPLTGQHPQWARLGKLIHSPSSSFPSQSSTSFPSSSSTPVTEYFPGKVIVVLGCDDEIVDAEDYERDGKPLLSPPLDIQDGDGGTKSKGKDKNKVVWRVVPGGHNFPMTSAKETLDIIYDVWGIDR